MPNGRRPVAAWARTQPSEKMSLGGPMSPARAGACSGERYPGEPITTSLAVSAVAPVERAMPKSINRGPSGASRTLPGSTSRCTRPAACTSLSASASRAPRTRTVRSGNGPCSATASAGDGPGTQAVASQGSRASGSAAVTGTTHRPVSPPAASASRRNRVRKSWSAAYSARMTFSATRAPPVERAR